MCAPELGNGLLKLWLLPDSPWWYLGHAEMPVLPGWSRRGLGLLTGFIASTSFANPAITLGCSLTGTFAGNRPADAPPFIVMQLLGALLAMGVIRVLFTDRESLRNACDVDVE